MSGVLWTAVYVAAVVLLAGRATGAVWTVRAGRTAAPTPVQPPVRRVPSWALAADRGWFPGGSEGDPEPQPAPAPEEPK